MDKRDIVWPREIKHALIEVVSMQKEAEANLMGGNPTLLCLNVLEVLESITEKIEQLKIYSGLDGLMNGEVRVNTNLTHTIDK